MTVYWAGNAAKHRAIEWVVRACEQAGALVVFDYGCGGGGDWPRVLADHPGITLVAHEPDPETAAQARARLVGCAATVSTGARPPVEAIGADVVVSFSVFEHVVDRRGYLDEARRHLRPDGTFFLNYDDGHFRNDLRLEAPRSWGEPLRAVGRRVVSPVLARSGRERSYTVPVPFADLVPLVEAAGFTVVEDRLENLPDFKAAAKLVSADRQAEFVRLWLETEDALHEQLGAVTDARGIPVLWSRMLSRTLTLRPV